MNRGVSGIVLNIMGMTQQYEGVEPRREEVDAMQGPTLIEFGSPWCGYCRAAQPLLEDAMKDHEGVKHIKIADASGRRLGRSFKVKLWPTLVFLSAGKEVARVVRPHDAAEIRAAMEKLA